MMSWWCLSDVLVFIGVIVVLNLDEASTLLPPTPSEVVFVVGLLSEVVFSVRAPSEVGIIEGGSSENCTIFYV